MTRLWAHKATGFLSCAELDIDEASAFAVCMVYRLCAFDILQTYPSALSLHPSPIGNGSRMLEITELFKDVGLDWPGE